MAFVRFENRCTICKCESDSLRPEVINGDLACKACLTENYVKFHEQRLAKQKEQEAKHFCACTHPRTLKKTRSGDRVCERCDKVSPFSDAINKAEAEDRRQSQIVEHIRRILDAEEGYSDSAIYEKISLVMDDGEVRRLMDEVESVKDELLEKETRIDQLRNCIGLQGNVIGLARGAVASYYNESSPMPVNKLLNDLKKALDKGQYVKELVSHDKYMQRIHDIEDKNNTIDSIRRFIMNRPEDEAVHNIKKLLGIDNFQCAFGPKDERVMLREALCKQQDEIDKLRQAVHNHVMKIDLIHHIVSHDKSKGIGNLNSIREIEKIINYRVEGRDTLGEEFNRYKQMLYKIQKICEEFTANYRTQDAASDEIFIETGSIAEIKCILRGKG
jgi:hypothetical protein